MSNEHDRLMVRAGMRNIALTSQSHHRTLNAERDGRRDAVTCIWAVVLVALGAGFGLLANEIGMFWEVL